MEEYTNNHLSQNTSPRANLLYSLAGGSSVGNRHHQLIPFNTFHHQTGRSDHCFQPDQAPHPSVKTESNNSHLHYPLMRSNLHHMLHPQQGGSQSSNELEAIKAKIIDHPHYSNLLQVYMDCQKVRND